MKTVLILVVSADMHPYDKMIQTSLNTWDNIDIDGCETIFYCGKSDKKDTTKIIYLPVKEMYETMGEKLLQAFQWALKNKSFDYIARINSSCYCDKNRLLDYVQQFPDLNVFSCIEVDASPKWAWGGGQYVISKDIIQKIVDNKNDWNHTIMEDVALSYLINKLEIPYTPGKACSINKTDKGWTLIGYGCESVDFVDFEEIKNNGNHFYRVKHDPDRSVDAIVMVELNKIL